MNLMYHFADCIETGSTGGESKEVPAPPATATESAPAPFRIPVQTGPQFDRAGKPTSRWTIPIQHRPPAPGEAGGESTTEPPSDEPFTAIL